MRSNDVGIREAERQKTMVMSSHIRSSVGDMSAQPKTPSLSKLGLSSLFCNILLFVGLCSPLHAYQESLLNCPHEHHVITKYYIRRSRGVSQGPIPVLGPPSTAIDLDYHSNLRF